MSRAARSRIGLGWLLAFAAACSGERIEPAPPGRIILFSMDTVRADRVSGYAPVDTMPVLREIASEGLLFRQFYAASTYTIPSHMSILTGLDPQEHGVLVERARLSPAVPTLAEQLAQAGWATQAFTEGAYVGARWGFDRGFDGYLEWPRMAVVGRRLDAILDWMRAKGDQPYFLFLHTYAAHFPYGGFERYRERAPTRGLPSDAELAEMRAIVRADGFDALPAEARELVRLYDQMVRRHEELIPVPDNHLPADFPASPHFEQDREALLASYDHRLRMIDRALGWIRATLIDSQQWDDTLLIVLSDHGEAFFEHGLERHGYVPFDEVLKVPLVVSYPRMLRERDGHRIDAPAWHLDILPSVLGLVGIEPPLVYAGVDLTEVMRGHTELDEVRSLHPLVAKAPHRRPSVPAKRVLIEAGLKYVEGHDAFGDAQGMLFDLVSDPGEHDNLRAARSRDWQRLATHSRAYVDALQRRGPVDQRTGAPLDATDGRRDELSNEEAELLRGLGYLDAAAEP